MDIMRCPPNVQLGNFLKCPTTIGRYVRGVGRICGQGQGHGQRQGGFLLRGEGGEISFCKRGEEGEGGKEVRGGRECGKIDPG